MVASVRNHSRITMPGSQCVTDVHKECTTTYIPHPAWPIAKQRENWSAEALLPGDSLPRSVPHFVHGSVTGKLFFLSSVQTNHCVEAQMRPRLDNRHVSIGLRGEKEHRNC